MSSDAFDQFAEEFGCWVTDHGLTGAGGGEVRNGVVHADVDLPRLESAIHDLIAEARAQVAADAINQIGHVLSATYAGATRIGLRQLRDELAELADGHAVEPEAPSSGYRRANEDRIGHKDWADGAAMDEARAAARDYPSAGAGSRRVLQHVLGDLQRRVARLEDRQPKRPAPEALFLRYSEVRKGDRLLDGGSELVEVLGVDVYDDHLGISVQSKDGDQSYLDRQGYSLAAVLRGVHAYDDSLMGPVL